ncbi:MAG TPA: DUF4136 domain-containing protein [Pseudomonas sp.]|nr:DUF4136 domain-containing protein [Pseudomonas sp.]
MGACKLLSLSLILLLGACRGANPYSADSRSLPPATPYAAERFDPSAYPATPRDFAAYRTWSWSPNHPPAGAAWASPERLHEALSGALDQRGLRPARDGSQADLRVAVQLRSERRLRQVREDYGGYYGHDAYYGDRYGLGARVPLLRTYEEEVLVLDIDLLDGTDGQPLWRGSAETLLPGGQAERADALRALLHKALADYPPR